MILDIISLAIFVTAFALGIHFFFTKNNSALYFKFIVCGVGCYTLAELFYFSFEMLNNTVIDGFSVTEVAYFGCYLFMLTANKGQFDSFIDDKSPKYRKYRYIAFFAPIYFTTMIVVSIVFGVKINSWPLTIIANACYIPMIIASYYNMKHLIWPNMDYGFIKSLRPTNLCLLFAYYADACCMLFDIQGNILATKICAIIIATFMLLAVIFARKGRLAWLT